jgi:hypothetical protein
MQFIVREKMKHVREFAGNSAGVWEGEGEKNLTTSPGSYLGSYSAKLRLGMVLRGSSQNDIRLKQFT